YTPTADFNGQDDFQYQASDGVATSDVVTVTLTIVAVNDAPVAVADDYNTDEDVVLSVPAPGVLDNDSDVEHDSLTAVLASGPSHGALKLSADGSFVYTPTADFNGQDSYQYQASDDQATSDVVTVTLTIEPVNDAPIAVEDAYTGTMNSILSIAAPGVLGNDSDVDEDGLVAVLDSGPQHGALNLAVDGSFVYTPENDFYGSDNFQYTVDDGTSSSSAATVSLTITFENEPPVAVEDSYATDEDQTLKVVEPGVLANDEDPDGNQLTAHLQSGPVHGDLSLRLDGSFVYTPTQDYHGSDRFSYRADDGTATSAAVTVTLTITSINDSPIAVADAYTVTAGTTLTAAGSGVLANDYDVDGDLLTAELATGPANGALDLSADGSFVYTPTSGFNGEDSFQYRASDGSDSSAPALVTLTVESLHDYHVYLPLTIRPAEATSTAAQPTAAYERKAPIPR
ncbi:MAG: Ig-like domain-containing protein, partial [Candidatus Promineifilaceae bacterium]|nr:Ig-like domain-containing protein [Candidatus Promineifilaceae bacterium]